MNRTPQNQMLFELTYIDRVGNRVNKTIDCDFPTATKMAQELAKASGRRATIKRKTQNSWYVFAIDGTTRERTLLWKGLSKREAYMRWKLWDDRGTKAVLIVLPQWFGSRTRERSRRKVR